MLAFLLQTARSSHLPKSSAVEEEENTGHTSAIYFDILVYLQLQHLYASCFRTSSHLSFTFYLPLPLLNPRWLW